MVSDKTDTVVFIIGSIKTEPHAPSQRFLEVQIPKRKTKLQNIEKIKRLESDSREKTGFGG